MAISLEATPASSARAFSRTFRSSTTALAPWAGGWVLGRSTWGALASGLARASLMASSSSAAKREPANPLGAERSRDRASRSVGAWVAISSIASSLMIRPRGWSRVWAVFSRQAATALNTAMYLGACRRGLSRRQAFSGVMS